MVGLMRLLTALMWTAMASALCSSGDHETKIIIGALLSLHGGDNCTQVDLGGMQEMAALESTLKTILKNKADPFPFDIELKTFDTCSDQEGAVKGVLKALVASKQTCSTPPLFAGFIGPTEPEELAAAHQVSAVFNITHSVPVMPPAPPSIPAQQWANSVFAVAQSAAKHRVQAMTKTLKHLNWRSIAVITDDSNESIKSVNMLQTQKDLCIKTIYKMNAGGLYNDIIAQITALDIDGVVVVTERAKRFNRLFRYLETNLGTRIQVNFLVYVAHVGIASWQLPPSTILMQEISEIDTTAILPSLNASLYAKFVQQQLSQFLADYCQPEMASRPDCSLTVLRHDLMFDLVDSSVTPLTYSLHLLTSALKTAHKIKCKGPNNFGTVAGVCPALLDIPAPEWKAYLTQTTVLSENSEFPRRIRLNTELPVLVNIYVKDGNTDKLIQVGEIREDTELKVMQENILLNLKSSKSRRGNACDHVPNVEIGRDNASGPAPTAPVPPPIATAPPLPTLPRDVPEEVERNQVGFDFWGLLPQTRSGDGEDFYETAVMLSVVGFGMLIFLVICIYIIYSNFRISSGKSDSTDGSGSPRGGRRGRREARSSSFRRSPSFRRNRSPGFRRQSSTRSIQSTGTNASA